MKPLFSLFMFFLVLSLTSCATILSGTTQEITINSNVDGAEVYLNDQLIGYTPLSIEIERGLSGRLRIEKSGYTPYIIGLSSKVNAAVFVNLISGGTTGMSTDYSTGAMYSYEPSTYYASLRPEQASSTEFKMWTTRERLRAFILQSSEALVFDLAIGQGEHLDVLFYSLDLVPETRSKAVERWRERYVASTTALDFANDIVGELCFGR